MHSRTLALTRRPSSWHHWQRHQFEYSAKMFFVSILKQAECVTLSILMLLFIFSLKQCWVFLTLIPSAFWNIKEPTQHCIKNSGHFREGQKMQTIHECISVRLHPSGSPQGRPRCESQPPKHQFFAPAAELEGCWLNYGWRTTERAPGCAARLLKMQGGNQKNT